MSFSSSLLKLLFIQKKLFWKFYHEPLHFLTLQCPLLIPKMFFTFNITVKYPLIGIICLERYNTLLTKFHPDVTPNSTWRFPTFCVDNHNDFQTFRTLWLHVTKFSTSPEFSHRYTAALLAATCFFNWQFFSLSNYFTYKKKYIYIFSPKLNVFPEHLRCPGQIHHSQKKFELAKQVFKSINHPFYCSFCHIPSMTFKYVTHTYIFIFKYLKYFLAVPTKSTLYIYNIYPLYIAIRYN